MQDLNPHVFNSLLCLIGIVFCLVLIVWGGCSDRRRLNCRAEPEPQEQTASPAGSYSAPNLSLDDKPQLSYRQVA